MDLTDMIHDCSIIVVNYNGKKYLDNFFNSLKGIIHDGFSFEVVFVDNASTDGSVEYLESKGLQNDIDLKIVSNTVNQGFAEGNDTGVENSDGKYLVFLNNDTAVEKNWLNELYTFIKKRPDCGMAASKLLFFYDFMQIVCATRDYISIDSKIQINSREYELEGKYCKNIQKKESGSVLCYGGSEISIPLIDGLTDYEFELTVQRYNYQMDHIIILGTEYIPDHGKIKVSFSKEQIAEKKYAMIQNAGSGINEAFEGFDIGMGEKDLGQYDSVRKLDAGCGASIIMRRSDFQKVGGFDKRFFMYYEDTDLSYRIKATGKHILFCPRSVVRHVHTGSSGEWSPFFTYHVYRNRLIFIYKNISKTIFFKKCLRMYGSALKHRDKMRIRCVRDAFDIVVRGKKRFYQ